MPYGVQVQVLSPAPNTVPIKARKIGLLFTSVCKMSAIKFFNRKASLTHAVAHPRIEAHARRLLSCKRPRDGFAALPTRFGFKSLDPTTEMLKELFCSHTTFFRKAVNDMYIRNRKIESSYHSRLL